ncbi:protein-export membrane protein SecF [Clostridium homopropionicum DSM 5847]|uniref:Protein-export membrane protein SecF n=1 Tax=Clostridium homopropionicum DSM 5847 TaxID=1121318 RepID=A0A0L6Z5J0_9CLOT|nr:hypothetical protein [Clostridium homopropionicum]KOA18222.1 protein-export membrane protein SecF [Clostridium homopropionicum DSM 5847]SFF71026.1 hypothetical protein SAMN04488501_101381 [Clostridium homopropionicum]
MPKPSIFSKDYDEKMRKRKRNRRIAVLIVLIVAVIAIVIASFSSKIGVNVKLGMNKIKGIVITRMNKDSTDKTNKDSNNNSKVKNEETGNNSENKNSDAVVQKEEVKKEETGEYTVKLPNGEEIKLKYSAINNEKNYIEVTPKTIVYDISPSKKQVVVLENGTQNLILFDINGTLNDISKKEYMSSKGTVFSKDSIIKTNTSFIWCALPKFINEDNIIYQSQLPWFNKGSIKYIWKYTISSKVHEHNLNGGLGEVFGADIKYGKLYSDGLEVIIDGNVKIVK